jgi:hypothetical protein
MKTLIVIMMLSYSAFAQDFDSMIDDSVAKLKIVQSEPHLDWLCTEDGSQRNGSIVKACGVAIASDEPKARTLAMTYAREEFQQVCDASSDCVNHLVTMEPARTTCSVEGSMVKCYRLLVYHISEKQGISQAQVARQQKQREESNESDVNQELDQFYLSVWRGVNNH